MSIAIIGAGMAGAACAQQLIHQGQQVMLFDKGRKPGGRMSSKRSDKGYLDLGAQYFTARIPSFIQQCQQWLQQEVIMPWPCRVAVFEQRKLMASVDQTLRYIGVPSMQKPVQQLLQSLPVQQQTIESINFDGKQWRLANQHQCLGRFKQLILAIPQQQAAALLTELLPSHSILSQMFSQPALLPCWAVDIKLASAAKINFDAVFIKDDPAITWLAKQNSKQGRVAGEHWLVHFSATFSQNNINASIEFIKSQAIAALKRVLNQELDVTATLSHRWLYAQQAEDYPIKGSIYLPELGLGLCGDWLNGGRIENAFLSGQQLAQHLIDKQIQINVQKVSL